MACFRSSLVSSVLGIALAQTASPAPDVTVAPYNCESFSPQLPARPTTSAMPSLTAPCICRRQPVPTSRRPPGTMEGGSPWRESSISYDGSASGWSQARFFYYSLAAGYVS